MSAPSIRWTDEPGATAAELGGKVNSLAEMAAAGFEVPPAFGVTTSAFRRFAEEAGLVERIAAVRAGLDVADLAAVEAASREIAQLIQDAPMPADLEADIRAAYARLSERAGATTSTPVAVRSSGVNEDLEGASFAGQYDTYLWICGADSVLEHVRRCWSGLFNPAVLTYRPSDAVDGGGAPEDLPGMCVGVQLMVRARTAGVMFTLDPVSGDRSKIVIESCWGLGEGVVKGDVTPDLHRVDKITLEVLDREVSEQTHEYRFDEAARGVGLLPITDGRGAECSLSEQEVVTIAELGKRVERHRGAPQDLEWAIDHDGSLRLLQARPETVWAARRAAAKAAEPAGTATDRVMATFLRFGAGAKT
jgi:pyruvate,water dikinase